ncbi:polysaccharide lyase [Glycomyces sp. NRRL B-16210]|uniref:polysaccharide lyase n=1 Tax=Glycomyces sp. NRRL B-16210 TaxID=1463821 RepID=UPI0004C18ACC|nr:polysaccharide lyase [Glycomyces sp. NRRL B-16210]
MPPRTVLAAATAALGLLAACSTAHGVVADLADEPEAIVFADFEDGDVKSGYPDIGHNECCSSSVQVAGFGRDSDASVRHELRQGDPPQAGGMRAESDAMRVPEARYGLGDTRYYAFSVYLPSTWEHDDRSGDIVFQWHNAPSPAEPCETRKAPSAFLQVHPHDGGEWRLRLNSDPNPCTTPETIDKLHLGLGPIALGEWTDFVFRFDWAYDDSGVVEVWQRTGADPDWAHTHWEGPNTYNDAHDSGYIKWGLYKPGWNGGASSGVDKRAVFHDNIALGTTCGSVMPPGWDPPCEAVPALSAAAAVPEPPAVRARRRR